MIVRELAGFRTNYLPRYALATAVAALTMPWPYLSLRPSEKETSSGCVQELRNRLRTIRQVRSGFFDKISAAMPAAMGVE